MTSQNSDCVDIISSFSFDDNANPDVLVAGGADPPNNAQLSSNNNNLLAAAGVVVAHSVVAHANSCGTDKNTDAISEKSEKCQISSLNSTPQQNTSNPNSSTTPIISAIKNLHSNNNANYDHIPTSLLNRITTTKADDILPRGNNVIKREESTESYSFNQLYSQHSAVPERTLTNDSLNTPYCLGNSFIDTPEDILTKSQLMNFPNAIAALSEEGNLLGLNEVIPERLRSKQSIRPVHISDSFGQEIVIHTGTFVLAYVTHNILPEKTLAVRHGYCLEDTPLTCGVFVDVLEGKLTDDNFIAIKEAFAKALEANISIKTLMLSEHEILEKLQKQGSDISYQLLKSKNITATYKCYEIDGYITLRRRPLLPSSSMMHFGRLLELVREGRSGMVLRLRDWRPIPHSVSIDAAFDRAINWGNATQTRSIGEINEMVLNNPENLIRLEETRFDMEVMNCALAAVRDKPHLKIVLISGPSASGKTTFAAKLALAFKSLGHDPAVMSTDDYYRDKRDPDYPRQPNGQPDFEVVDALRLPLLHQHIKEIMSGKEIIAPVFDMILSRPKPEGVPLKLGPKGLLIMEGIFSLDPKIQQGLEEEAKSGIFTIFISPMPFFFLDEQTFIKNSVMRLIRRIARDYLYRGRDAAASIKRLQSVNKGEINAVLPHISRANYFFNSVMAHELPILRVIAVPLLRKVVATDEVYPKAQQLVNTLIHITSCSDKYVSNTSLLREFIGGSVFEESRLEIDSEQRVVVDASPNAGLGSKLVSTGGAVQPLGKCLAMTFGIDESEMTAGMLNGVACPLSYPVQIYDNNNDDAVSTAFYGRPILTNSTAASTVRRATITFLMHVAVCQLWPTRHIVVSHGFGAEGSQSKDVRIAFFVRVFDNLPPDTMVPFLRPRVELTSDDIDAIKKAIDAIIERCSEINVRTVTSPSAMEYFIKRGMRFTVSMLQSRNLSTVDVVMCEKEMALYFQPLTPHAGFINPTKFYLTPYDDGFALVFHPDGSLMEQKPPPLSKARTEIQRNADEVRFSTRISCVGDMNKAVFNGECGNVVQINNAAFQRRVNKLVNEIRSEGKKQIILIAGSSSSGKSVLTEELLIHLCAAGIPTRTVAIDNYYKNAGCDDYPVIDGHWDYENIKAIKLDELERDLELLLSGKSVESPLFDIGMGKRKEDEKITIKGIPPNGVLIIEGIFALNDSFLPNIPHEKKLLIVVHPTSIINVDELRFVSNQVLRMLRCIARDYLCRRRDARESLTRWHSVVDGEDKNITPFIDRADITFNASSIYEVGALKSSVLPLLENVSPAFPEEYEQAQTLRYLLQWYHDVPDSLLPYSETLRQVMYGNELTSKS